MVTVQKPVVAGTFYPAEVNILKTQVEKFIADAPLQKFDGKLIGLISPHAGYQYSGAVAGAAYKQLEGRKYSRVVVLALSHRVPVRTAALSTREVYRTPLGDIPIDVEAVRDLIGSTKWAKDESAPYEVEHSLEVQLPFLQVALKDFKLVPIIVGAHDKTTLDSIAESLNKKFSSDETLFVASSDLSHYHPYNIAVDIDKKTLGILTEQNSATYYNSVISEEAELCGSAPVYVLKKIAELRGAELKVVEYANSGDTSGDKSGVVGYGAVVVIEKSPLDDIQKKALLKLARDTITAHVNGKKLPQLPDDPVLKKNGAAFVTLKERGELRGCIGHILAQGPINKCVQEMAIVASTEDPRFPPVKSSELKDIEIEISILTEPQKIKDPLSVRIGIDGIIIQRGYHQGVFLPQVPIEQGWDLNQYLEGICQKAGLPPGSWKDANLSTFQAIVFGE